MEELKAQKVNDEVVSHMWGVCVCVCVCVCVREREIDDET